MTNPLRIVLRVILCLSLFFVFDLSPTVAQEDNPAQDDNPSVPVEINGADVLSTQQRNLLATHKLDSYFQELPQVSPSQMPSDYALVPADALSPRTVADVTEWSLVALQAIADGSWEIFVATADGQRATRLTNHPESDVNPSLIPGAYRVAFTSFRDGNSEIYTVNLDGSGLTRLTNSPESDNYATWSPNGQELLFSSQRDGHWQLYRMNADGSNQVRITVTDPNVWDFMPAWSPNGSQIAWVRATTDGMGYLWVMNADGSNARQIGSPCKYLQNPAWRDEDIIFADCDVDNDYFNETSGWAISTGGPVKHIDLGMWVDAWMGNFEPLTYRQNVLFTAVRYAVQGNQVVIVDIGVYQGEYAWTSTLLLPGAASPHWETADIWAPQTWLSPLPKYSRFGTTILELHSRQVGPARLVHLEVEAKSDVTWDGAWWPVTTQQYPSNPLPDTIGLAFQGTPGYATAYRIRGTDDAHNVEAWPDSPDGNVKTTYYAYKIEQTWSDNRNRPIYGESAILSPEPIGIEPENITSAYTNYLVDNQAYGINASTPFTLYPYSDQSFQFYAAADDDVIRNGNFENTLEHWFTPEMTVSPAQIQTQVENKTALLGRQCVGVCLSKATDWFASFPGIYTYLYPQLAEDSQGTLHVLYADDQHVWYTSKSVDGAWTEPILLHQGKVWTIQLLIDNQDVLHASIGGESRGLYMVRVPGHEWQNTALPLSRGNLTVSANGKVFFGGFFWAGTVGDHTGFYVSSKASLDASWTPLSFSPIWFEEGVTDSIVATPDGLLHLFRTADTRYDMYPIEHRVLMPDGQIVQLAPAFESILRPRIFRAISDPSGQIHMLFQSDWRKMYYTFRDLQGQWSEPILFNKQTFYTGRAKEDDYFYTRFWSATDGTIHYVADNMFYRYKLPGEPWAEPVVITGKADQNWGFDTTVFVDSQQKMHIIQPPVYQVSTADVPYSFWLAQPVAIPASMHKPTLAFNYQLPYTKLQDPAPLWVDVTNSMTTTTVYTATGGARWQLGWADMTPWLGQTITVTFRTDDTPGAAQVFLDNVSLSSWKTPVVHSVTKLDGASPRFVQTGQQTSLLIQGENFISTPTVKIGEHIIQQVTYRNETQLEVVVPADFAEGIYTLQVINPGGELGFSATAVHVGNFLFLSNIFR